MVNAISKLRKVEEIENLYYCDAGFFNCKDSIIYTLVDCQLFNF